MRGGVPVLVEQVALLADRDHRAHGVEEVGDQQREDEQRRTTSQPARPNEPSTLKCPSRERSGVPTILSGSSGTFSAQPVGFACRADRGPTFAIASTMIASMVVPTMPIRIAPFTLRATSTMVSSRPTHEDERRPAVSAAADAELDRHGGAGDVRHAAHEPGVDEADERDEQADADADRGLELRRDGAEHRRPEAGEHQDA